MENKLFGMGLVVDYTDNASSKLLRTNRIFNTTHESAQQLTQSIDQNIQRFEKLGMVGAGLTMAGFGMKALGNQMLQPLTQAREEAKSFEKEMAQLKFVSGAVGEEFDKLRQTAIETGIETAFSPQEATKAMYELKSAGLDTNSMLESLKDTLDIVAISAGKIDLGEGATLMASTLKSFNLDASESARVASMFAKATQESNFHMEEFLSFIRGVKTAPSMLGSSLEEMLALGSMFRNVGSTARMSGEVINSMAKRIPKMLKWIEEDSKRVSAMEQLGLTKEALVDAEGNVKSLSDIFGVLMENTRDMSQADRQQYGLQVLGARGQQILEVMNLATEANIRYDEATQKYIATTKEGKKTYTDLVSAYSAVNDEAERGAEALLSTTWGIEKLWEGTQQTFKILLGSTVMPIVNKVTGALTNMLNSVIRFGESHKWFMKALGWGTGLAGLSVVATGTVLMLVGAVLGLVGAVGVGYNQLAKFALAQGWVTASSMSLTGVLGGLQTAIAGTFSTITAGVSTILTTLLPFIALAGGMYFAWKYNFGNIKTILTEFAGKVDYAFERSQKLLNMDFGQFARHWAELEKDDSWVGSLTRGLTKVKLAWEGITELWSDDTMDMDLYKKLGMADMLTFVQTINDWKHQAQAFIEGIGWSFMFWSRVIGDTLEILGKLITPVIDSIWTLATGALKMLGFNTMNFAEASSRIPLGIFRGLGVAIGTLVAFKFATWVWGAVSAIGALGTTLVTAVIPAIWGFTTALLANPITWVVAGIVGLVATVWWLANNWDTATQAVADALSWLAGWIEPVMNTMAEYARAGIENMIGAFSWLGTAISGTWNWIKDKAMFVLGLIGDFVEWYVGGYIESWNLIIDGIGAVWNWVRDKAVTVFSLIGTAVDWYIDAYLESFEIMKNAVGIVWNWIKDVAIQAFEGIGRVIGIYADMYSLVFEVVGGVIKGVWTGVADFVGGIFDWVGEKVNSLMGLLQPIVDMGSFVGDKVSGGFSVVKNWVTGGDEDEKANEPENNKAGGRSGIINMAEWREKNGSNVDTGDNRRGSNNESVTKKESTMTSISNTRQNRVQKDNSVKIESGAIQITAPENASQGDIEQMAEEILRQIEKKRQMEDLSNYEDAM